MNQESAAKSSQAYLAVMPMDVQHVALSDVIDQLNGRINSFPRGNRQIRRLVPEEILDVLDDRNVSYIISDIPFWSGWEAGKIEVTDHEFIEAVLGVHAESNTHVILVSDDCFSAGAAYWLPANQILSLPALAEDDKSLFQPFDHIFYLQLQRILTMVHHDGKVITADLSGMEKY